MIVILHMVEDSCWKMSSELTAQIRLPQVHELYVCPLDRLCNISCLLRVPSQKITGLNSSEV